MKERKRVTILVLLALVVVMSGPAMAETETIEWTEMPYGVWMAGTWSGVQFNEDTGKYEGIGKGMGYIWAFNFDDTFAALSMFFNNLYVTGKYAVEGNVLTLTERVVQETTDGGLTWGEPEAIPDEEVHWILGHDEAGTFIMFVEKDAEPPFEHGKNAFRYDLVPGVPIF